MNGWLGGMNEVTAGGLAALLNTLWYAGAVVALAWVALRFCPRVNAATRYWIWTGVLGFLLIAPFLPSLVNQARSALIARPEPVLRINPVTTIAAAPISIGQTAPITLTLNAERGASLWPLWLAAAWMVTAGWQLTRLARGLVSARRLKANAEAVPISALPARLRRSVQVLTSTEVVSPVSVGYARPAVVIPPALLAQLEEGEWQDVLLHELAHLARYDDWMALVGGALGALLSLHPLAPLVLGQIEREREMACDDFVVARTGSARNYARSLARLHDLRWSAGTRLLAPGILGRNSSLADRIESLLRRGREFSAQPSLASLGVSAILLFMLLAAGGLVPDWITVAHAKAMPPQSTALSTSQETMSAALKFEVASIKPHKPGDRRKNGMFFSIMSRPNDSRFYATGPTLRMLIRLAYDIQDSQIVGGPSWINHDRFDIQAKGDASADAELEKLPLDEARLMKEHMLQNLLRDRFGLTAHRETRTLPIYALVIAKNGPKLQVSKIGHALPPPRGTVKAGAPGGPLIRVRFGAGEQEITSQGTAITFLAQVLSQQLGRTVVDKTGLQGRYDFTLKWTADIGRGQMVGGPGPGGPGPGAGGGGQSMAGMPPAAGSSDSSSDSSGPSVFTAVQQQLGLRLKPEKGPVEVLVIDHVEQPSAN
ncbi:MAG TPA: M56 family metallopeptidase [Terriglobia bacterium]|nr:M56 family metallopeptidase [Terriglobia bacterium]